MDNVCNRCLFFIPSKVEMAEEQEYLRCFCFGNEAMNASGEAVRGLVKSRGFAAREIPRGLWRFRRRSPAHESR